MSDDKLENFKTRKYIIPQGRIMGKSVMTEGLKREMNTPLLIINKLERLAHLLDTIPYECNTSVYTVEDDDFETVFRVRDELTNLAKQIKDIYNETEKWIK